MTTHPVGTAKDINAHRSTAGPWFDFASWRLDGARVVAAACLLSFAIACFAEKGVWIVLGGLLVVDVSLQALPWRLPRADRSTSSILVEEVVQVAAPTVFLAVALVAGETWLTALPSGWWFLLGLAIGAALILASGIPMRALVSGALASLLPPLRRPHKWARAFVMILSPPGEEAAFRGIALGATPTSALPLGLLGGIAFVARHHLAPGLSSRTSTRMLLIQISAAALFLALTLASGSIYPALAAHALNNAPYVVLEIGRGTRE